MERKKTTQKKTVGRPKKQVKEKPRCMVTGCSNQVFRTGLCNKHYTQKLAGVDVMAREELAQDYIPKSKGEETTEDIKSIIENYDYAELNTEALYWQMRQRQEATLKLERDNAIREGEIVEANDAQKVIFEMMGALVARLRQVQYILTPLLINQSNPKKIQDTIEKEMNKAFKACEDYLKNANE